MWSPASGAACLLCLQSRSPGPYPEEEEREVELTGAPAALRAQQPPARCGAMPENPLSVNALPL